MTPTNNALHRNTIQWYILWIWWDALWSVPKRNSAYRSTLPCNVKLREGKWKWRRKEKGGKNKNKCKRSWMQGRATDLQCCAPKYYVIERKSFHGIQRNEMSPLTRRGRLMWVPINIITIIIIITFIYASIKRNTIKDNEKEKALL